MHVIHTIIPIFAVIFLGWAAQKKGFLPSEFIAPANRLVFYLAIPAMVFHAVSKASLKTHFQPEVLGILLVSILVVFALAWATAIASRIKRRQIGTFIQCTFHSNLGYIGLAVAYYALGTEGFTRASILAGFVMILQNFLAVIILQIYGDDALGGRNVGILVSKIAGNPVVISAFAGILFSATGLPMPSVLDRSLEILSGLALPMALLLIGATLSLDLLRRRFSGLMPMVGMKLMVLPGVAFCLFVFFDIPVTRFLPGIILLASPTATLTYVMAKEMNGDAELAVAAISGSTLLSALTWAVWLNL